MTTTITARRCDFRDRIAPALESQLRGRSDCAYQRESDSFMVWRPHVPLNQIHLDLSASERFEITWPSHGGPAVVDATFDEVTGRYAEGTEQELLRAILAELARPLEMSMPG